jgi:hypothetical protein
MDRIRAGLFCGRDDSLHVEVALARRGRPDVDRLVGVTHVQSRLVRVGVDGDGGYPQLPARPDDAQCDLTAICDQYLVQH